MVILSLLDTDLCVDLLKGRNPRLDARLRACGAGEVGVSTITVFELSYGAHKSAQPARNRAALTAFFPPLVLVPFDAGAAALAGELRAALERAGTRVGPNDLLIASQALALDVPGVTNNERGFRRVPRLWVENWSQ
ncbi:MAG: type II toxin-antitoxin system VapC family toxin [Chloroflexota bacterium]|nr:type II toxin-antitoxin system VapC family toxin [Chloroflexota bacterium]